jgi:hypothetical protein
MDSQTQAASPPSREQVTQLAHQIWLAEGCPQGRDLEHWQRAERQLRQGQQQPAPQPAGTGKPSPDAGQAPDASPSRRRRINKGP